MAKSKGKKGGGSKGGEAANDDRTPYYTDSPKYSDGERSVYHDHSTYSDGKRIKKKHRQNGVPVPARPRCKECVKIDSVA